MSFSIALRAAACAAVFSTAANGADFVDIKWDAKGAFAHSASIAPGGFFEACGNVARSRQVEWKFEAGSATDFNIHYHVGDKVEFPDKRDGVATAKGVLKAPVDQGYCWMWSNKGDAPVVLRVELVRR